MAGLAMELLYCRFTGGDNRANLISVSPSVQMLLERVSVCVVLIVSEIFAAFPENASAGENGNRSTQFTYISPNPQIIGGELVKTPIYYQASLRVQNTVGSLKPSSLQHVCGGTFVDTNIVVTAAHCLQSSILEDVRKGRIYVVGGTRLLNFNPYTTFISAVAKAETHPHYNSTSNANDVAVLKLREGYKGKENVGSVPLRSLRVKSGHICNVSGWGTTEYGDDKPVSKILKSAYVPVIDNAKCRKKYWAVHLKNVISDDMMCAGYETGGTDACQGDSGGPMICDGELAGIVSWGYECALPRVPGVYVNVSHLNEWIQRTIQKFKPLSSPKASSAQKSAMNQLTCTVLPILLFTIMSNKP